LAALTPSSTFLASIAEILPSTTTISTLTKISSATTASTMRIRVDASRLTLRVPSTSVMPKMSAPDRVA
jgi:hypothetical protein